MGRPDKVPAARPGSSHPEFFRRSGAGAVALAASAALLTTAETTTPTLRFEHGIASGDPLADRVIPRTGFTPATPRPAPTLQYLVASERCALR